MSNNFYSFPGINMPWDPQTNGQAVKNSYLAQQQNQYHQAPAQQLIAVNGLDSANAYPVMPNSRIALFDNNEDVVYIKQTDSQGFSNIKAFRLVEFNPSANMNQMMPNSDYVTKQEFDQFKQEVLNAQQPVQQQSYATPATNAEQSADSAGY